MSQSDIAIRVDGVYKDFKLPHQRKTSVKSIFTGLFDGGRGKNIEVQHALKDISFEVKKGEFFGIVGRNGSGKSTLLKILADIYQPTKGSVQTSGKMVPFIELGVGFNPELTGRENVYLNGALLGFDSKKIDSMYSSIVEFAELEKFMDQKLKNYSSGMQVRLAFSMAVRADADILLIDEVLAVGDADFQRKCFDYFKSLKKDKKTVVFVSHNMDAIREYCNNAVLIEKNKIVSAGTSSDIAALYTKMFMKSSIKETGNSSKRWGDQTVKIGQPSIEIGEKKLTIHFSLSAKDRQEGLISGFSIKNKEGLSIIGTNTILNNDDRINLNKNTPANISYELANYLNDGAYSVDIAILGDDSITVREWWETAIEFTINKARHLPSITNTKVKYDIK